MQVSAKTNDNIEKMFKAMGLELIAADKEVRDFHQYFHIDFNMTLFFIQFTQSGQKITKCEKQKKKSKKHRCEI